MAVIKRLSHLIRADLHAALDYLEEPAVTLRQAIRDMEVALSADMERREELCSLRKQQSCARERSAERIKVLDEELDVCFAQLEDELARAVVRKKLDAEAGERLAQESIQSLDDELGELDTRLKHRGRTLAKLKLRAEATVGSAPLSQEEPEACAASTVVGGVSETDVDIAFLQEREARRQR